MKERQMQQGWISRRFLIVILILLALIFFSFFIHRSLFFPIQEVLIQGNLDETEQKEAQNMINPLLGQGFFGVNLDEIQATLQQLPDVGVAEVKRIWPGKLFIFLSNQTMVATWNQHGFLNRYGEFFLNTHLDKTNQFLELSGPEGSEVLVVGMAQQFNQLLSPLSLTIKAVHLSDDKLWSVELDNGMVIQLGQSNILDKLTQLISIYPTLTAPGKVPKSVDLRYQHGMAVKW